MAIEIVTDSTCDLPKSVTDDQNITVVPCYINVDDQSYLDGMELSRQEFYQRLPDYASLPTTSAPGIETFLKAYQQLATQGTSGIISIHVSGSLSNIFNIAQLAAERIDKVPVTVIDSGQLRLGTGLLVLAGAKASAACRASAHQQRRDQTPDSHLERTGSSGARGFGTRPRTRQSRGATATG